MDTFGLLVTDMSCLATPGLAGIPIGVSRKYTQLHIIYLDYKIALFQGSIRLQEFFCIASLEYRLKASKKKY